MAVEKRVMRVVISAKDVYSAVMSRAGKAVRKFASLAKTAFKAGALVAVALTTALITMAKTTAKAGDIFQKMSLRTGVAVEALSELKHAAEISGASIDDIEKGFKTLSKRMLDADNNLSTAVRTFERLEIEIKNTDGTLRSADAVFMDSVKVLKELTSATEQSALAQELFGKAGPKLLPLIKLGQEGIADLREEAQRLGITFTQFEADQAAEFEDALTRLKGGAIGLKNVLGKELIPTFIEIMDEMKDRILAFKEEGGIDDIVKKFKTAAQIAQDDLLPAVKEIAGWLSKSAGFVVDFSKALGIAAAELTGADLRTEVEKIKEELEFLEKDPEAFTFFNTAGEWAGEVARLKARLTELNQEERTQLLISTAETINNRIIKKKAADDQHEEKKTEIEDIKTVIAATAVEIKTIKDKAAAQAIAFAAKSPGVQEVAQADVIGAEAAQLQTRFDALVAFHNRRIAFLTEIGAAEIDIRAAVNQAQEELDEQARQTRIGVAQATVGALASIAESLSSIMGNKSKAMLKVVKAAAIAEAILSAKSAAVAAWDKGMKLGGPPLAAVFTAASLLKTGAMIASIGGSQGGDVGSSVVPADTSGAGSSFLVPQNQVQGSGVTVIINSTGPQSDREFWSKVIEDDIGPLLEDGTFQGTINLSVQGV